MWEWVGWWGLRNWTESCGYLWRVLEVLYVDRAENRSYDYEGKAYGRPCVGNHTGVQVD